MARTRTRVHRQDRLIGNDRANVTLNWRKLGPDGWRQVVPVPSSLSLHALWWTLNPHRRQLYTNLPGPVDTVTTYGQRPTRSAQLDPELDAYAVEHETCPRCKSEPGDACRTPPPARRPTRVHAQRRELARVNRHYGAGHEPATTALPGPLRGLLNRVLGVLAVIVVARVWLLTLGDPTSPLELVQRMAHR